MVEGRKACSRPVSAYGGHEVGERHELDRCVWWRYTVKAVHESSSGEVGRQRLGRGHKYLEKRRLDEAFNHVVLAHGPKDAMAIEIADCDAMELDVVKRVARITHPLHESPHEQIHDARDIMAVGIQVVLKANSGFPPYIIDIPGMPTCARHKFPICSVVPTSGEHGPLWVVSTCLGGRLAGVQNA